jgi:hypothetical protein
MMKTVFLMLVFGSQVFAESAVSAKASVSKKAAPLPQEREKPKTAIDFEHGELLEDFGNPSQDSLDFYSSKENFSRHSHLYDEKRDFHPENMQMMKTVRYLP